ncbi:hypothetical protein GR927_48460 [Mycolicibacterium sp. 3033]|nr:hypothetical protein [Mycolicibacterium aurantiacum]
MSAVILRPRAVVGPVEAMRLRESFDVVAQTPRVPVIVDLTGVSVLSAAGLAAVTNIVMRSKRSGTSIRVLLPEQGSAAAEIIDHADLWRFLATVEGRAGAGRCRPSVPSRPADRVLVPA